MKALRRLICRDSRLRNTLKRGREGRDEGQRRAAAAFFWNLCLTVCLSAGICIITVAGPASGIDDVSSGDGSSGQTAGASASGGSYAESPSEDSVRGTWLQDKFGWWYLLEDGSYPSSRWMKIRGVWYYFRESGYMAAGPLELDGIQYFLEDSGAMVSERWLEFRGEMYYFNADGSMAKSCWVDDVHYVGQDGCMVKDKWVDGIYIDEEGIGEHPDAKFFESD